MGSPLDDPRYRDAQRLRNYWRSRQLEHMRDEGDLYDQNPPRITGWHIAGCIVASLVIYALIVAALVLYNGR